MRSNARLIFSSFVLIAGCTGGSSGPAASSSNAGPNAPTSVSPASASQGASATHPSPSAPRNALPASGTPDETRIMAGTDACASDADCVPATCCHPTSCVAKGKAPACGDAKCTEQCEGATMDCGGGCLCQAGKCAARLVGRPR